MKRPCKLQLKLQNSFSSSSSFYLCMYIGRCNLILRFHYSLRVSLSLLTSFFLSSLYPALLKFCVVSVSFSGSVSASLVRWSLHLQQSLSSPLCLVASADQLQICLHFQSNKQFGESRTERTERESGQDWGIHKDDKLVLVDCCSTQMRCIAVDNRQSAIRNTVKKVQTLFACSRFPHNYSADASDYGVEVEE